MKPCYHCGSNDLAYCTKGEYKIIKCRNCDHKFIDVCETKEDLIKQWDEIDRFYIGEKAKKEQQDVVNHPAHYTKGKIECIDAIEAATDGLTGFKGYCTGNIIKYLWRWHKKNGLEDLKKAEWYLKKLIAKVEKE